MKILLTIMLCVSVMWHAYSQKAPIRFGEIPMDDMKMETYPSDSSASAVVLTDFGESKLHYSQSTGFSVIFDRILRIKILTKDGLDWATVSVPLYHDGGANEKISSLKASTFNLENGKIVESRLKNDGTFREKVNENVDMVKFTLPNVRQGSIVEVSYRVNSDFLFNFQDWDFQCTIPTRWSEYRASIPEFYHYEKFTQGYVPLTINETNQVSAQLMLTSRERDARTNGNATTDYHQISYQEFRYRWAAKDVPAFRPEPFMTTAKDYISRINFELAYRKFPGEPVKPIMGTWEDINKQYLESPKFGGEITSNGFLKKIAEEAIAGQTTPEAKVAAINNYVKRNVEWNGRSYKLADKSLRSVLDEKKGSSSEINLLMASMLEKVGINVSPVLISTRDHGFVRQTVPISSQFNYVICIVRINDKSILLDATDPLLGTGILPQRCLNGEGLVISRNGHSWISLTPKNRSREVYSADLALTAQGELQGKVQFDHSGYFARECRKNYISKGEGAYTKDFVANRQWTIGRSEFVNARDVSESFKEVHEVTISDHLTTAADILYLNPFLDMREKENPFKSLTREYPVDFGSPMEKLYLCKITIPDGYAVEEMPAPKILKLGDNAAKYTYSLVQSGNTLSFTSHFQINNSLFAQTEYAHLREFYDIIVAKQAEQIVLKKKL